MSFRLVPKSVTLNGVIALILRYFTEFGSFWGTMPKVVQDIVLKSSCSLSSPDEFLVLIVLLSSNSTRRI